MKPLKGLVDSKISGLYFFIVLLLLYILFPANTHSVDAWAYAADIKFGEQLFKPHHLLYNATGYSLRSLFHKLDIEADAMRLMLLLNGVIACLSAFVLYRIVRFIGNERLQSYLLTALAAFSFGQWRYATENETYILPLFFSLLGSLYYLKHFSGKLYMDIFLSGFFLSIACLFHQTHIFWWLCFAAGTPYLSTGNNRFKALLTYVLPFVFVPLAYFLVLRYYYEVPLSLEGLKAFVLHDFYSGAVGKPLGLQHFSLGFINLFRTFFQVHGNIKVLITNDLLYLLPIILTLMALGYFGFLLKRIRFKFPESKKPVLVFCGVFILQFAFAVYNVGNAEFMVMLPPVVSIILAHYSFPHKILIPIVFSFLLWNFSLGIYPNYAKHFSVDSYMAQFIQETPETPFIPKEPALIRNMIYYKTGREASNIWQSPVWYVERRGNFTELKTRLDSFLAVRPYIYTDCIGRPLVFNRAHMVDVEADAAFFSGYKVDAFRTFETDAGNHTIYKVSRK